MELLTASGGGRGGIYHGVNQTATMNSLDETIRSLEVEKAMLQANVKYWKGILLETQNQRRSAPNINNILSTVIVPRNQLA